MIAASNESYPFQSKYAHAFMNPITIAVPNLPPVPYCGRILKIYEQHDSSESNYSELRDLANLSFTGRQYFLGRTRSVLSLIAKGCFKFNQI